MIRTYLSLVLILTGILMTSCGQLSQKAQLSSNLLSTQASSTSLAQENIVIGETTFPLHYNSETQQYFIISTYTPTNESVSQRVKIEIRPTVDIKETEYRIEKDPLTNRLYVLYEQKKLFLYSAQKFTYLFREEALSNSENITQISIGFGQLFNSYSIFTVNPARHYYLPVEGKLIYRFKNDPRTRQISVFPVGDGTFYYKIDIYNKTFYTRPLRSDEFKKELPLYSISPTHPIQTGVAVTNDVSYNRSSILIYRYKNNQKGDLITTLNPY